MVERLAIHRLKTARTLGVVAVPFRIENVRPTLCVPIVFNAFETAIAPNKHNQPTEPKARHDEAWNFGRNDALVMENDYGKQRHEVGEHGNISAQARHFRSSHLGIERSTNITQMQFPREHAA